MEIEKLKRELLHTNLDYLDKINIPDNNFGIEIEFAGALFIEIKDKLDEILGYTPESLEQINEIKKKKEKYEYWRLVKEPTVQENEYEKLKGGEINSPIMKNEKKYWQELEQVCEMLRERENITISDKCGIHIHTDMGIFKVLQEYKNLLKIYIVYEDIINRFAYGVDNKPRKTLLKYAKPFGGNIDTVKFLKKIDNIETEKDLLELIRSEEFVYSINSIRDPEYKSLKNYGINLINIIKKEVPTDEIGKNKIKTIEKKIYKSTLNTKIIQNYARFDFCLLDYCKIENFDSEFIDYKIKNFKPICINDSLKEQPEKADEFFNKICKDELDRLKLLKQYYKVYNEFDIEKSIHL